MDGSEGDFTEERLNVLMRGGPRTTQRGERESLASQEAAGHKTAVRVVVTHQGSFLCCPGHCGSGASGVIASELSCRLPKLKT